MWYRRGKRGAWREGGRKEERGREGGVGGPGCSGRREEKEGGGGGGGFSMPGGRCSEWLAAALPFPSVPCLASSCFG